MPSLQVRDLPAQLHGELIRRAHADGVTVSELVTRLIRRQLAVEANRDWLAELSTEPERHSDIDIESLMDEIREG